MLIPQTLLLGAVCHYSCPAPQHTLASEPEAKRPEAKPRSLKFGFALVATPSSALIEPLNNAWTA